jgi:hypothetical protein
VITYPKNSHAASQSKDENKGSSASAAKFVLGPGPAWAHVENACQAIIWVSSNDKDVEGEELDYWSTTDDPTQFRAYIQDVHTGRFIPGVKVTALRSKVMTKSDAKGLFTLEVAASWRKGKAPPEATETLVFSKPGYRQLRYERLVLNPGADGLDVILE